MPSKNEDNPKTEHKNELPEKNSPKKGGIYKAGHFKFCCIFSSAGEKSEITK